MTRLLRLDGVSAGYDGSAVIVDVDLTVDEGEVVALLGANGAGKTTTLLTVSGIVERLGGELEVLGEVVPPTSRGSLSGVWRRARGGVAHVPEDRGLFFELTGAEHLRLGRRPRSDALEVDEVLAWFPALERILGRRAGLLSGGEQQMLALAKAVIGRPRLLLVDEMSLGLAPIIVEQLIEVLRTIATETGVGVLVVEQHVGLVLEVADRAYVLRQGRVAFAGDAQVLIDDPDLVAEHYLGAGDP